MRLAPDLFSRSCFPSWGTHWHNNPENNLGSRPSSSILVESSSSRNTRQFIIAPRPRKAVESLWSLAHNATNHSSLASAEEPLVYNLGVNIVVYALTREGSLARQLVDVD